MSMQLLRVKIRGHKWVIYLTSQTEVDSIFKEEGNSDSSRAFVEPLKQEAYFSVDELSAELVRHELMHIIIHYLHLHDAELDFFQAEEVFCNLFAVDGPRLVDMATKLYETLILLRDTEAEELVVDLDDVL
jgi:hypothetical protein